MKDSGFHGIRDVCIDVKRGLAGGERFVPFDCEHKGPASSAL